MPPLRRSPYPGKLLLLNRLLVTGFLCSCLVILGSAQWRDRLERNVPQPPLNVKSCLPSLLTG